MGWEAPLHPTFFGHMWLTTPMVALAASVLYMLIKAPLAVARYLRLLSCIGSQEPTLSPFYSFVMLVMGFAWISLIYLFIADQV